MIISKTQSHKFVEEFNKEILDVHTLDEVSKIYPSVRKIGTHKLSHFYMELKPNLFAKAYHLCTEGISTRSLQQFEVKDLKEDFEIDVIYSRKDGEYVNLYKKI